MVHQVSKFTKTLDTQERKWFAIRVMAKSEKVVARALGRKGIPYYLPIQTRVRHYTRKTKTVELPLLKGYLLVHLLLDDYIHVLDTQHVVGFVKSDNAPAVVRDEEIELLRRVEGSSHYAKTISTEELIPGSEMEIIGGDLTGLRGRLVEVKGKEYVSIELIHMDSAIILEVDRKYLSLI